jgi:hypothetical protein
MDHSLCVIIFVVCRGNRFTAGFVCNVGERTGSQVAGSRFNGELILGGVPANVHRPRDYPQAEPLCHVSHKLLVLVGSGAAQVVIYMADNELGGYNARVGEPYKGTRHRN